MNAEAIAPRLRILIAARDAVGTGGGMVATETARRMAAEGHEVVFLSDYPIEPSLERVRCIVMPIGHALRKWNPKSKLVLRIRHLVRIVGFSLYGRLRAARMEKEGFVSVDHNLEICGGDVVVLHNVFAAQARADRRHWIKKIPQCMNPTFGFRIIREILVLRSSRVRAAICVSEQTLVEARSMMQKGLTGNVIHSGIDTERFKPATAEGRLRIRSGIGAGCDSFVVAFVGHEFERKRLDLAILALRHCPAHVMLWVIGGRFSDPAKYAALAQEHGVSERVVFLGTRADIENFMPAADCFVLPSDYETWGLVALEAMACGVPVLMTNVGCAPHVIREAETGFVVEYSATSIARAINKLSSDPKLLSEMRLRAREEAERHGWNKVTGEYLTQVRKVHAARREHGA